MDAKQAVHLAKSRAVALIGGEGLADLRLEGLEYHDAHGHWLITLGLSRYQNPGSPGAAAATTAERQYADFTVGDDGLAIQASCQETGINRSVRGLYALIGSVASTWSHLEREVDVTLWCLARVDSHIGACLTAQIQSLGYRLDALGALARVLGAQPDLMRAINQFRGKADDLGRLRNRVVHDPIATTDDKGLVAITITARKTLQYGLFDGKVSEYADINDKIAGFLGEFQALKERISREILQPLPLPPEGHLDR